MTPNLVQQLKSARRAGVPLVAINTPDSGATIQTVSAAVNGDAVKVAWDYVRGFTPVNPAGKEWISGLEDTAAASPVSALIIAAKLPVDGVVFVHLANRWIGDPAVIQATWNLRDEFKADGRTLVMLAKHVDLPAELSDDVVVFDEPLPDSEALSEIVRQQHENAELTTSDATVGASVEALRGLSAFAAEQITAMSLSRDGLNVDALWEKKRQAIEQTPGLKVFREGEKFDAIGGCDVVKGFLTRVMQGQARPNAVVFIDEIEKMIGGKGDLSGVSQDQLGTLLSYMQDHNAVGMIFIGPPGAAKSAIAKAAGNEGGVPTIQLDLGAAKGSLVGQSEQQVRQALKVITSVSNGKSLWIATCNSIGELPPELRRRFTLGTFFFDLPSAEERVAIWNIWVKRYELHTRSLSKPDSFPNDEGWTGYELHTRSLSKPDSFPTDEGWTGAEIKQCCDIAWRLGCSLVSAAAFVVPVSKSAGGAIQKLREQANGKFLSASVPGLYTNETEEKAAPSGRRKVTM